MNDTLLSGAGADRLYGEDGDDTLDGGLGNDRLYGGDGGRHFARRRGRRLSVY